MDVNATGDDSTASDPTAEASVTSPTNSSLPVGTTEAVTPEMLAKQVEEQTVVLGHLRHSVQMFAEKSACLAQNVSQ